MKRILNKSKKGFTLVELIVVIAIIAILSAVSVAGYFGFIDAAKKSASNQEAQSARMAIITETTNTYSVPFAVADSTENNIITTSSKISNSSLGVKVSAVTGTFTPELAAKILVLLVEQANSSSILDSESFPTGKYNFSATIPESVEKPTFVVTESQIVASSCLIQSFTYISKDGFASDEMLLH